ncbi:MAG: HAD hydrolase-like protein [Pseudomonadota bacterium]
MSAWIFLDLDGTLSNAEPGITAAIAHALREMDLPVPPQSELARLIGPALQETFPALGAHDVDQALKHYRAHYNEGGGMYDAVLYDGALAMMAELRDRGYRLAMATAKPIAYAAKITEHFGVAALMDRQFGSELDGRNTDKRDLLGHALTETGADPSRSFMLGDRMHDARGAIHNGITALGALWGFGDRAELEAAGCAAIAEAPMDIPEIVERLS